MCQNLMHVLLFDISTHTDVHQVYPQEGSVHGGTLVTISGTGFSADDGEIEVDIDGIPCQVRVSICNLHCTLYKP